MINQIKQFVPSSVCLKCEGCCRFQLADTDWRPKVGQEEVSLHVDASGHVNTVPANGHHHCVYFNKADFTCQVYAKRPFECALYPFVLSQTPQGLDVHVHLACPYVQDNELKPELQEYADYLKEFFSQGTTKEFLKKNSQLLHDYSRYALELKFVFNVNL